MLLPFTLGKIIHSNDTLDFVVASAIYQTGFDLLYREILSFYRISCRSPAIITEFRGWPAWNNPRASHWREIAIQKSCDGMIETGTCAGETPGKITARASIWTFINDIRYARAPRYRLQWFAARKRGVRCTAGVMPPGTRPTLL